MKINDKSCGDVNEGKASEIVQAENTPESQATTNQDILGVTTDDQLLEELKESKENNDKGAPDDENHEGHRYSPQAKLNRVMPFLLQNNDALKGHFYPREISVGPLHAASRGSRFLKKELKLKLGKKFINDSYKTPANFLEKIKSKIKDIKEHFHEKVIPDNRFYDDSLARLLFLDGCAVLQFIRSCVHDELEEFEIDNTQAAFIQEDLFLFENQIPFEVLTLLMDVLDEGMKDAGDKKGKRKPSDIFRFCIICFVHEHSIFPNMSYSEREFYQMAGVLETQKPDHLLDLLRKVSIFGSIKDIDERSDHVLSFGCFRIYSPSVKNLEKRKQSLRSVQELKLSGITMKLSDPTRLKSVDFNSHCFGIFGHLKLPPLTVNHSTVRKLLNLVAHERCLHDNRRSYSVTSYLNFLDLLIDTEQDVKDLRIARVLRNALGSDKEVATFFNTLGLSYLPKSGQDHFERIHIKIEEHYARKCAMCMARMYINYLRNPWPTLGIFLAPAALLITVVQTWFTIYPRD